MIYTVAVRFKTPTRHFAPGDPIEPDDVDGQVAFGDWYLGGFIVAAGFAQLTTTIASGNSLSTSIPMSRRTLVAIAMPAAWNTANLTFQVSIDNGVSWQELYNDSGSPIGVFAAAGTLIRLRSGEWTGIDWMRIRSGEFNAPVTQTSSRVLTITVGSP